MFQRSWKYVLVAAILVTAFAAIAPQASACCGWRGCGWGCGYGCGWGGCGCGCYSPCYTSCYSCYTPCCSTCAVGCTPCGWRSCCYGYGWGSCGCYNNCLSSCSGCDSGCCGGTAAPIISIAGGCVTMGAIDDGLRHSITKLSHLHFAETQGYADRIVRMGEEPWRVVLSGALGLDHMAEMQWMSVEELNAAFGLRIDRAPLVVTFHPVTREYEKTEQHIRELLAALAEFDLPIVFTYPNADTSGRIVIEHIDRFVAQRAGAWVVPNLGTRGYLSLLRIARAMVGNSSSGIVEAPSFKLPVVNVGNRQRGRTAAANILHAENAAPAIAERLRQAISDRFRRSFPTLSTRTATGTLRKRFFAFSWTPLWTRDCL